MLSQNFITIFARCYGKVQVTAPTADEFAGTFIEKLFSGIFLWSAVLNINVHRKITYAYLISNCHLYCYLYDQETNDISFRSVNLGEGNTSQTMFTENNFKKKLNKTSQVDIMYQYTTNKQYAFLAESEFTIRA